MRHYIPMKLPWPLSITSDKNAAASPAKGSTEAPPGPSTIRTSEKGWFTLLARSYKTHTPVLLVDDAKVGIDPQNQSLLAMGMQAGLSPADWTAVAVSIGMSVAGITMVVLAFLDPEPTSKLGLLVGGGAVCVVTGGLTAIGILLRRRPPSIEVSSRGISIRWE